MNYNALKNAIEDVIKDNGNEEITGDILQHTLLAMVNSLGAGFQFIGVATPATNPSTPDQKVFYVAGEAGTYTNFGGLTVSDGEIAFLKFTNVWAKESIQVSGGGSDNTFIAFYDDTTWDEVKDAYDGGKIIYCLYGSTYYPLVSLSEGEGVVLFALPREKYIDTIRLNDSDEWSNSTAGPFVEGNVFIANYEETPYADIREAYEDGKMLYAKFGNLFIPLTWPEYEFFIFSMYYYDDGGNGFIRCKVDTTDVWSVDYDTPVTEVIDNLTSYSSEDALSANQGRVLKGLVDGADKVFIGTPSTTHAQYKAAFLAGKIVFHNNGDGVIYRLLNYRSSLAREDLTFTSTDNGVRSVFKILFNTDTWQTSIYSWETANNRKTDLANPDNTHYPTTKAVVDYVSKGFQLVATVTTQEGGSNSVQLLASCEGYTEFLVDRRCDTAISTGVYLRIGQKSVGFLSLNSTRRAVFRVKIDGAVTICDESTYNYAYDGRLIPKEVYTQYDAITQSDALNLHYYQLTEAPAGETIYVYAK